MFRVRGSGGSGQGWLQIYPLQGRSGSQRAAGASRARTAGNPMSDIMSILSSSYATTVPTTKTKYVNVDPTLYTGKWEGKYANNQKFQFDVSSVQGFRAQVRYTSGSDVKFQQVLIKDGAFKIGNSKFTLQKNGHAQIKTVVVDPATGGTSLDTAYAQRS
jgi:hypothetical protein